MWPSLCTLHLKNSEKNDYKINGECDNSHKNVYNVQVL